MTREEIIQCSVKAIKELGYSVKTLELSGKDAVSLHPPWPKTVYLRQGLSDENKLSALVHELGHILMHSTEAICSQPVVGPTEIPKLLLSTQESEDHFSLMVVMREADAELFTCLVLRMFGYDHTPSANKYMHKLLSDNDVETEAFLTFHKSREAVIYDVALQAKEMIG